MITRKKITRTIYGVTFDIIAISLGNEYYVKIGVLRTKRLWWQSKYEYQDSGYTYSSVICLAIELIERYFYKKELYETGKKNFEEFIQLS